MHTLKSIEGKGTYEGLLRKERNNFLVLSEVGIVSAIDSLIERLIKRLVVGFLVYFMLLGMGRVN